METVEDGNNLNESAMLFIINDKSSGKSFFQVSELVYCVQLLLVEDAGFNVILLHNLLNGLAPHIRNKL